VVVSFEGGRIAAEVVADDASRARGLMHRSQLAPDAGMLFVFPGRQGSDHGFWMKNTLIPLSIAYMVWAGETTLEVVAVRDMEPCRRPDCPSYPPGVPYDAALEVNQGWFAEHGVGIGSRATVQGDLPTPR
jgi:uncharacterized membrane protein (UPF0127 family)